MTTGERIRARRKELGITADVLADHVGVSRSTIFRWENGFIEKLPIDKLVPIARVLQTTIGYLMGWDEDNKVPASGAEDEYEINRHRQLRKTGRKIDRRPVYCATDYHYIRFNTSRFYYEVWNDSLRPFYC